MNRIISIIILCLFFLPPLAWADSTQFNPMPITVEAKGGGGVPVGTVIVWPSSTLPSEDGNWLECNGQAVDATLYPELAAIVGANVPDYRGIFLRGFGTQYHAQNNGAVIGVTSTEHTSGALGQMQGDAVRNIVGSFIADDVENAPPDWRLFTAANVGWSGATNGWQAATRVTFNASRVVPVANENRPANKAVRYFIRALP